MEADDVRTFYRTYVVPSNVALVISGAIDAATVQRELESRFGVWRPEPSAVTAIAPVPEQPRAGVVVVSSPSVTAVNLFVAFRGPGLDSDDRPGAEVAAALLRARLEEEIADRRGWAYFVHTALIPLGDGTTLSTIASLDPSHVVDVLQIVKETHRGVARQPSSEEVDAAKRVLVLEALKRYATSRSTVESITSKIVLGFGPPVPSRVTVEQVQSALSRIVDAEPVVVLVGPLNVLGPQLEKAGVKYDTVQR